MNIKAWVSDLNTTAFSSATSQVCWIFGSFVFTLVAAVLFLREKPGAEFLAGALLTAWGVKSGFGVVDKKNATNAKVDLAKAGVPQQDQPVL